MTTNRAIMPALAVSMFVMLAEKPACAFDDTVDGHFLLEIIEASRQDMGAELAFLAYVSGFVSGQKMAWSDYQVLPRYCIPDDVNYGDVAQVVRRFVEHGSVYGLRSTKPHDFLNLQAITIMHVGLSLHYRCGNN